jgi:hypothetical protein
MASICPERAQRTPCGGLLQAASHGFSSQRVCFYGSFCLHSFTSFHLCVHRLGAWCVCGAVSLFQLGCLVQRVQFLLARQSQHRVTAYISFCNADLMWSVAPLNSTSISTAGVWVDMPDMSLSCTLARQTSLVLSYGVSVIAEKPLHPGGDFLNDNQEASGLGDFLGARLTVDGVPYRQSGSHVSPLASLERSARQLRGHLVLNMPAGNHTVRLQWKKWGTFVRSWSSKYALA